MRTERSPGAPLIPNPDVQDVIIRQRHVSLALKFHSGTVQSYRRGDGSFFVATARSAMKMKDPGSEDTMRCNGCLILLTRTNEMSWETRIFFDISNDRVKSALTLDSKAVAKLMFPHEQLSPLDSVVEERTDDYLLLSRCPNADQIGLKARGADNSSSYYTLVQLKTVSKEINEKHGEELLRKSLACWIKSSQYVHGSFTDRKLILEFLKGRPNQPLAKTLMEWVENQKTMEEFSIVRARKLRRLASVGSLLDVEQTDVVFSLPTTGASSAPKTAVTLRSWAVEGDDATDQLQTIAKSWSDRYVQAASASAGVKTPPMWVASYPAMILKIPELIKKVKK